MCFLGEFDRGIEVTATLIDYSVVVFTNSGGSFVIPSGVEESLIVDLSPFVTSLRGRDVSTTLDMTKGRATHCQGCFAHIFHVGAASVRRFSNE
jgi:hypothetical protein